MWWGKTVKKRQHKGQPWTGQHCRVKAVLYQHYALSVYGWSVAGGVSFGTLQEWLIPEHGWVKEEEGGEGGRVGQGQYIPVKNRADLEPWGVEFRVAPCSSCFRIGSDFWKSSNYCVLWKKSRLVSGLKLKTNERLQ